MNARCRIVPTGVTRPNETTIADEPDVYLYPPHSN